MLTLRCLSSRLRFLILGHLPLYSAFFFMSIVYFADLGFLNGSLFFIVSDTIL